ncbi:MAG: tetratricopeptide repeat-containing sensor histidine kinase [Bacteroidetes bacterium]|nr:tetratricopeptide repeat-containing sensor histidine kinase [Bacteroidota bacterium]
MSKLKISALLLLLFTPLILAQPKLDSVLKSIQALDDTSKAGILSRICWDNRTNNPSLALKFGWEALGIYEKLGDSKNKGLILDYFGVIHSETGNLDSAYYYYNESFKYAKLVGDSTQIAYSYNNLGDYFFKNALYSAALENMMHAFHIFENIGDKQGMAYALNDIGEVYLIQQDYAKALDYFKRSAALRLERDDKRGYAKSLINIANAYTQLGELDKAKESFLKAIENSKAINYLKGVSQALRGMSEVYFKKRELKTALEYSRKSIEIDIKIENKYGEIINTNIMAKIYMELGDLVAAQKSLDFAKSESEKTGHLDQLLVVYEYLTDLAVMQGDYKQAYIALREHALLKDKIFSQTTLNKIADLQTAFMTERKDRENEVLRKDVEYQKVTTSFLIIVSILVIGGILLMILRYKSEKKAKLLLVELNSSKDRFFSILAHDLKNPFFAVKNLAEILHDDYEEMDDEERKDMAKSINKTSGHLSQLLNNLLTWARAQRGELVVNPVELKVSDIFSTVMESFESSASAKNIKVMIKLPEDVGFTGDRYILETILGNLLNNAIKFSYPDSSIQMEATKKSDSLELSVLDHGTGMDENVRQSLFDNSLNESTSGTGNEKGTGLGLKLVKELADIHKCKISVESEPGRGSKFTLAVPL